MKFLAHQFCDHVSDYYFLRFFWRSDQKIEYFLNVCTPIVNFELTRKKRVVCNFSRKFCFRYKFSPFSAHCLYFCILAFYACKIYWNCVSTYDRWKSSLLWSIYHSRKTSCTLNSSFKLIFWQGHLFWVVYVRIHGKAVLLITLTHGLFYSFAATTF